MSDTQTIFVDERNGRPQRTVAVYRGGAEIHRDFFNTDDSFRLQQFAKAVRQRGTGNDDGWQELFEAIRREADAKDQAALESLDQPITYRRYSSRELDEGDFITPVVIDGALFDTLQTIVGGPSKALKSSIAVDAAIAIDQGGHWLGYFPVRQAKHVSVFSGESGMGVLQDLARRVCRAAGKRLCDTNIDWSPDLPILGHFAHSKALAQTLKDWQTEVAIFDCAYLMLDDEGDAKSIFGMGHRLRWLTKICHDSGVLPMLLHHATKAPFYTPMELHHLAYSGFDAWAAQWWLVNRREPFDPEGGLHKLYLTVGSRLDHAGRYAVDVQEGRRSDPGGRRWEVTVTKPSEMEQSKRDAAQAAQEAGKQEQLDLDRKLIVERCLKMTSGGTETDIRKRARINGQRFAFAFTTLVDDGTFQECELVKGNNRKFQGFKLRSESDE